MQEPTNNFKGLRLNQIKDIVKKESGFEIDASLIMKEGQTIVTNESDNSSAVVINEQLTKEAGKRAADDKALDSKLEETKQELVRSIADEAATRGDADKAIEEAAEALAKKQESDNEGRKSDNDDRVSDMSDEQAARIKGDEDESAARQSAIEAVEVEAKKNVTELTTAFKDGDNAIQKQIDFLLDGSSENLDQVIEILDHIAEIDVENDETLASAVASLTAADLAETAAREDADQTIKEVADALAKKQEFDNEGRKSDMSDEQAARIKGDEDLDSNLEEAKEELTKSIADEAEARETADKAHDATIKSLSEESAEGDKVNAEAIANLSEAVDTAITEAVQNSDFKQGEISLAGKVNGESVEFTVAGNTGVLLTFVDGLFVPSTTSYDESGNETTVSFNMFFDADEASKAHYLTVNFS
jgi:ribosomal protein L29